jgi:hypothetical protein
MNNMWGRRDLWPRSERAPDASQIAGEAKTTPSVGRQVHGNQVLGPSGPAQTLDGLSVKPSLRSTDILWSLAAEFPRYSKLMLPMSTRWI